MRDLRPYRDQVAAVRDEIDVVVKRLQEIELRAYGLLDGPEIRGPSESAWSAHSKLTEALAELQVAGSAFNKFIRTLDAHIVGQENG